MKPDCAALYDARYGEGYLSDWPAWKRQRVAQWIRSLPLPREGRALDFGCGAGVFTHVLGEALPGWEIHGADISPVALDRARENVPDAHLHVLDAPDLARLRFDLVFSHHVLEHVADLEQELDRIAGWLGDDGVAAHVLPCGNAGSLEHRLCALRRDGIDASSGRFFFEEPGHLRRLDAPDLTARCAQRSLKLVNEAFACHEAGAEHWITASPADFIREITDPRVAVGADAARELARLRRRWLRTAALRRWGRLRGARRWLLLPLHALGRFVERRCQRADAREWQTRRADPRGSEMYLCFARRPEDPAC